MIKYGVGGRELKKSDNKEVVLTDHGFTKRCKEEKQRSSAANEAAKRLVKNRNAEPDMEILAHYSGYLAECKKNEDKNGGNSDE